MKNKITSRQIIYTNRPFAVVGDIHEHSEQFFKILDKIPSDYQIISLGDVYDKGFGEDHAEKITQALMDRRALAVIGNHELKKIRKTKPNKYLDWWKDRPLVITINKTFTIVHAGIEPIEKESTLGKRTTVCYCREVDEIGKMIPLVWKKEGDKKTLTQDKPGTLWHELYDGRFGFVISGHVAQKDGTYKQYKNSINIDSGVYESGVLTAVLVRDDKIDRIIQVDGPAKNPLLDSENT